VLATDDVQREHQVERFVWGKSNGQKALAEQFSDGKLRGSPTPAAKVRLNPNYVN